MRDVILGPCDRRVLFLKQMAHHLIELDRAFLGSTINVLLVRDPLEMLPSLAQQIPAPTLRDTAYAMQTELYDELRRIGQDPPVLDARARRRAGGRPPAAASAAPCRRAQLAAAGSPPGPGQDGASDGGVRARRDDPHVRRPRPIR